MRCSRCRSSAINPHLHGRDPAKHADLCDVCYWRCLYDEQEAWVTEIHTRIVKIRKSITRLSAFIDAKAKGEA